VVLYFPEDIEYYSPFAWYLDGQSGPTAQQLRPFGGVTALMFGAVGFFSRRSVLLVIGLVSWPGPLASAPFIEWSVWTWNRVEAQYQV